MIYTFYSFKGGVGRSMALANVAELLYRRGLKVLIVDFDLEAPGLERFFEVPDAHPIPQILDHRGVIDMLTSYKELRSVATLSSARPDQAEEKSGSAFPFPVEPLSSFIVPIYEQANTDAALLLMPAGRRFGPELTRYAQRVQSFDWDDFYVNWNGEQFFDWFRQETEAVADIVLVDSRTGFTEMSGVCTFHLADVVIMFVAANQQNLDGTLLMARSLQGESLIAEGRKGRPLWLLFTPSRIEQSESDLLDHFADQFLERLAPYISPDLRFETNAFIDLKIPYVPRYAYLESVAVREPDRPVAADLITAYNRLTSAMIEIAPRSSTLYAKFQAPTRKIGAIEEALAPPVEFFTGRTLLFHHIEQWLASDGPPLLTVIGAPGSGKTALVSRLAELSRSPVLGASQRLSSLTAAHLCNPLNRVTLDPLHFVESIFRQLAVSYPSIAVDLAGESPTGVRIDVKQTIGSVKSSAQVAGVQVRVNVTDLSPLVAFDLLIRRPLHLLCRGDFDDTILIAVDGVEAAVDAETKETILSVITYAIFGESGLPRQVRLLLTSRPDPRVLASVKSMVVNLDEDAEATLQDIRQYAHARLLGVAPERRDQLADRIVEASRGNFLYARLVLDELQNHPDSEASVGAELPTGLIDIYRTSLQAIVSSSPRGWEEHDRAFLGVLAAARAPGLTTTQLAGILQRTRLEVKNLLQTWAQFLSGAQPDGPFRFYHSSFRDFLLTDREFGIDVGESHQAIVEFLLKEREEPFDPDDYLVTNLLGHLVEAIRAARGASVRERLLNALWSLLSNVTFLAEVNERGRMAQIMMDLEAALSLPGLGDGAEFLRILLELARSDPQEMIRVIRSGDHPDLPSRFGLAIDTPYEVSIHVATGITEIFGTDVEGRWENRLDVNRLAWLADRRREVSTDQYGSDLFSLALPHEAADRLRSLILQTTRKRCRIRLRIDPDSPELNDLWWETLRDVKSSPVRFARSDRTPFSREVVRAIAFDQPVAPADGLRILVAFTDAPEEWTTLLRMQNLQRATVDVLEQVRGLFDLRSRLSKGRYHVLHLVTVGTLADGSARLRLVSEDFRNARLISDTALADLLLDLPDLRLVVLSAPRQESSSEPVFVRIAASLIGSGFPAALALQTPLTEAAELLFFETMYTALSTPAPPPLDVAVNEAREALFFELLGASEDDSWLWAAPVLYLHGDGRLFQGHSSDWEPRSTNGRK